MGRHWQRTRAGTVVPSGPVDSLTIGLGAYWKMEELETGPVLDSLGRSNLARSGNPVQVEGIIDNAQQFVPATGDDLHTPDAPWLRPVTAGFTLSAWVWFDAVAAAGLVAKQSAGNLEYLLECDGAYFDFQVTADGLTPTAVTLLDDLDSGVWHHIVAKYDAGLNQASLIHDNAATASVPFIGPVHVDNNALHLGKDPLSGQILAGRIDEVGLWQRPLTPPEITRLYNTGAGLTYPFAP